MIRIARIGGPGEGRSPTKGASEGYAGGGTGHRSLGRADQASPPQPPIFNLNAYSPAEIKEAIEKVGVKKANLPFLTSMMLAAIAGGSIGLGALYYTIIASDAELSFATARMMGGLAFSLGLVIVLIAGAELFTGNNLIVMAWASGDVSTKTMLRNWVIVYFGNLIG